MVKGKNLSNLGTVQKIICTRNKEVPNNSRGITVQKKYVELIPQDNYKCHSANNQSNPFFEDIDYNDIFSLVAKHSSIRVLLALVAAHDMELE